MYIKHSDNHVIESEVEVKFLDVMTFVAVHLFWVFKDKYLQGFIPS